MVATPDILGTGTGDWTGAEGTCRGGTAVCGRSRWRAAGRPGGVGIGTGVCGEDAGPVAVESVTGGKAVVEAGISVVG